MTCASKVAYTTTLSVMGYPTTTSFKSTQYSHDFWRVWWLHENEMWACVTLEVAQEWGLLSDGFQRLPRLQKSLLWSFFKNKGHVQPSSDRPRCESPEKEHFLKAADPGDYWDGMQQILGGNHTIPQNSHALWNCHRCVFVWEWWHLSWSQGPGLDLRPNLC